MSKIVILEGPDGGGKTELAERLVKHGFEYRHEGIPADGIDLMEYYKANFWDALTSKKYVVFDRFFLGECVYGPIFRGVNRIGENGLKLFERLVSSYQVWHYICMPSEEILKANYLEKMKDPNDYVKGLDNLQKVTNAYYAMMLRPNIRVWDYETSSLHHLLELDDENPLPIGTIGSRTAKYLFIGDIPNHPVIDFPFFSLNGSSGYFNKALELCQFKEEDIALSNAFGPDGKPHHFFEMRNRLKNLTDVILMGNKVTAWFNAEIGYKMGLRIHNIQHPSYLKRFRGANPQIMASMIQESIDGHLNQG